MAGQIRTTPEEMRQRANEYRSQADNLGDIITAMDSLLTSLQEEWEGVGSESYAAKFAELRPGFVEAEQLINNIAAALDSAAEKYEETDTNIGSAFSS